MKKNAVSDLQKNLQKSGVKKTRKNPISNVSADYEPIPLVDYKDLITSKEVCEMFHISIDTLYKWVEAKRIPHYKISQKKTLFNKKRLIQWLNSCEVLAE